MRGVTAVSTCFIQVERFLSNVGEDRRAAKAFAVETKVSNGIMISSPSAISSGSAVMSSADEHECVSSARGRNRCVDPLAATPREAAIAGQVQGALRLGHQLELLAG
nr:hypothetical protein [Bradyrhizobium jicamae]